MSSIAHLNNISLYHFITVLKHFPHIFLTLNLNPSWDPNSSLGSQFKQYRIYSFLERLHNYLTICNIVVFEKMIIKHFSLKFLCKILNPSWDISISSEVLKISHYIISHLDTLDARIIAWFSSSELKLF